MSKAVPKVFIKLAHELERAAIDAGYERVCISFNTDSWSISGNDELYVSGYDPDGKIHIYREGGE